MDKAEMIERALGPLLDEAWDVDYDGNEDPYPCFWGHEFIDALAEQAIVMDAEIKHFNPGALGETTMIRFGLNQFLTYLGIYGTPGKALAIIVSIPEKTKPSPIHDKE